MTTIWKLPAQVIKPATSEKSDKIYQTCFSPCKSMKSEKFPFQLFLVTRMTMKSKNKDGLQSGVFNRTGFPTFTQSEAATLGVLKNFRKKTGKHLCWSLFSMKFWAFNPESLLKRDSDTGRSFPVNTAKFLRTLILKNICERLHLTQWLLLFDALILFSE